MISALRKIRGHVRACCKQSFQDTEKGACAASLAVIGLFLGGFASEFFVPRVLFFFAGTLLGGGAAWLMLTLCGRVLGWFLKGNGKEIAYCLAGTAVFGGFCAYGSVGAGEEAGAVFGAVSFLAVILFSKSLWAFFRNKVRTFPVKAGLFAGGIYTVLLAALLFGTGFLDSYIDASRRQNGRVMEAGEVEGFAEYAAAGEYTPVSVTYGPDADMATATATDTATATATDTAAAAEIVTGTVDLSRYVAEEPAWRRLYRSLFTEHTLSDAPIAGKIWYPKEASNCPVIFMAHGNHSITEKSWLGYDYLGEYLASHGYVFVSVDETILNERSGENDARAILLLENIAALLELGKEEDCVLYGKLDEECLALAGHSRGGEMIADAYLFNDYDTYPSNGMFSLDYHFQIKALLAVAPSAGQYLPAGHEVELCDVNYLVLQGANDQDITVFQGNEQYENITFSGEGDYIASSLYIAGANHGQFNTLWGSYDSGRPFSLWLNVKNLIGQEEQQEILKLFALVFFDKTLKGEDTYADLLTDYARYAAYLPDTLYVQQYQTSDVRIVADFEEDSDITETGEETELTARHMAMWTEEELSYSVEGMGKRENYALRLKWKETKQAYYEIEFSGTQRAGEGGLLFDACNLAESGAPLDFTVVLTDGAGRTAEAAVSSSSVLYPAFPVRLSKIQYVFGEEDQKYQFQTVQLPLRAFSQESGFDAGQIKSVRFLFDKAKNGALHIDNIGFAE